MLQRQLRACASSASLRGTLNAGWRATLVSWAHVPEAPKDPILGVSERYLACTNPEKMNLGGEATRTDSCLSGAGSFAAPFPCDAEPGWFIL